MQVALTLYRPPCCCCCCSCLFVGTSWRRPCRRVCICVGVRACMLQCLKLHCRRQPCLCVGALSRQNLVGLEEVHCMHAQRTCRICLTGLEKAGVRRRSASSSITCLIQAWNPSWVHSRPYAAPGPLSSVVRPAGVATMMSGVSCEGGLPLFTCWEKEIGKTIRAKRRRRRKMKQGSGVPGGDHARDSVGQERQTQPQAWSWSWCQHAVLVPRAHLGGCE